LQWHIFNISGYCTVHSYLWLFFWNVTALCGYFKLIYFVFMWWLHWTLILIPYSKCKHDYVVLWSHVRGLNRYVFDGGVRVTHRYICVACLFFCVCPHSVSYAQCCLCLWISHSLLPLKRLQLSLSFMLNVNSRFFLSIALYMWICSMLVKWGAVGLKGILSRVDLRCSTPFSTLFQLCRGGQVSFWLKKVEWSIRRKPPNCRKSSTNFIA
jgi:hypothetical protein